MFLLCSVHTTGWIQWKEMSRYLLFLKEFVFSNHFYLYIPSWVGWVFFPERKAIQHSFHSKPKSYDALPHLFFEKKETECDSRVFLLWCRDTDLEAALNIQHAQPYLTYGVKNKPPSLLRAV